jgi:hypothetical protein
MARTWAMTWRFCCVSEQTFWLERLCSGSADVCKTYVLFNIRNHMSFVCLYWQTSHWRQFYGLLPLPVITAGRYLASKTNCLISWLRFLVMSERWDGALEKAAPSSYQIITSWSNIKMQQICFLFLTVYPIKAAFKALLNSRSNTMVFLFKATCFGLSLKGR